MDDGESWAASLFCHIWNGVTRLRVGALFLMRAFLSMQYSSVCRSW